MTMYTILPKNEGVISWVLKHGIECKKEPIMHRATHMNDRDIPEKYGAYVVLCLFRATHGPILRVCYNSLELRNARISCANASGPCRWFWVPIEVVKPFMHGQEIK